MLKRVKSHNNAPMTNSQLCQHENLGIPYVPLHIILKLSNIIIKRKTLKKVYTLPEIKTMYIQNLYCYCSID